MKLRRIIFYAFIILAVTAVAMTDQQVIDYIKKQSAAGKSQQQIGKELLAKGVTPEQAERIKQQYENQQSSSLSEKTKASQIDRQRSSANTKNSVQTQKTATTKNASKTGKNNTTKSKTGRLIYNESIPEEELYVENEDVMGGTFDEIIEVDFNAIVDTVPKKEIFGHRIFSSADLTFEPNENIATPPNYRLGPGDEVIIDIWGANEEHIKDAISPEGSIMIEQLGPVYLNGMTVAEANRHIKAAFTRKYAGMAEAETDIELTLGQVRSILVNIMGEVTTPGTYLTSPFASVFHALYLCGGVNDIGSLRNIQVIRNGKKVAGVDIYEYIFDGKTKVNVRLQEGDVIIVPPYEELVDIQGNVKRPMYYEMKPNETVETLLKYAGGFAGDAYTGLIRLQRQTGNENELFNVEKGDFADYKLKDGDVVTVGTILDRFANRVELEGAVMRPGEYAIGPNLKTVGQLIEMADGLTEDAYTKRVLLYREGPELQLQVMALDLGAILNGTEPDVDLRRNDYLVISSIEEIMDRGILTIDGHIQEPGDYPYAENTTLEDLILQAGGLLDGASTARVDIARRIVDPTAIEQTNQLAETFSVSIDGGLGVGANEQFMLKPYDIVHIRVSPGYEPQEVVSIKGEVLFEGDYVLQKRNERVTDLVKRAGGILDAAYVKGAHLERKLSEDEYQARKEALRLAIVDQNEQGQDSISLEKLEVAETYNVGIDLQKAMDNPGTHYDLVLEPGDKLYIPQIQSTVKIAGDVMFPNSVVYEPGKKLKYYIDQAGGYGERAKKGKAFIVYLNGTVAVAKRNTPIEPGCQIIVPSKSKNSGADWSKIMALATSFTSVATMAATIANIFKR